MLTSSSSTRQAAWLWLSPGLHQSCVCVCALFRVPAEAAQWRLRDVCSASGLPLRCVQAGDEDTAEAAKQGKLPRKLAARQKVLRSQAILQGAHAAKPAAVAVARKPKGSVLQQQERAKRQQGGTAVAAAVSKPRRGLKEVGEPESLAFDAWEALVQQGDGWTDGLLPAKRQRRAAAPASRRALVVAAAVGRGPEALRPAVPAVEIDPAGCSYNPDPELHQEAVATAVAAETRKLLDKVH